MKIILFLLSLTLASGLSAQQHPKVVTSPFFQSLTEAYLALQTSLAQDDLNGAHDAALHYIAAFDKSSADLHVEALTQHADKIASASNIEAARSSFKPLTEQAKMLFDYVASNSSSPLYVVNCSMAFEGEGAEWIQSSTDVANPYYGASMLKCGSIVRQIGSTTAAAPTDECCQGHASTETCDHSGNDSCCSM